MHFELKDVVTIAIAALGAVLGIINTWHALDQRRVRLRVVPKLAYPFVGGDFGQTMGCIEVINLSAFPVSISEIGFTLGGDPRKNKRLAHHSSFNLRPSTDCAHLAASSFGDGVFRSEPYGS